MKKAITLMCAALLATASAQSKLSVGLVLDSGGKNDRSFNQAAYEGALRAKRDFGVSLDIYEPAKSAESTPGINKFSNAGKDLIIGVGFASNAAITEAAKSHPSSRYAVVDDLPSGGNTAGLRFREQEGSFLVGYIAARSSSTGVVGFVGGMDVPVIHKFEAGFRAGVKFSCPSCKVLVKYIGDTPAAWNNPDKAKNIADNMKDQGADVIFAAAGGSGKGVIDYVNKTQCLKRSELPKGMLFKNDQFANVPKSASYQAACGDDSRPMFFIGVDSNQNYLGDTDTKSSTLNHGLTSMVKRVDNAVYALIRDAVRGQTWRTGERGFSLQNDGVEYALDTYNKALIPASLQKQLETVQRLIINGTIKVPKE
ncbi:BMP family lipoprotein [Deinococcus maricopensis]|uniref:Basic membrane lipoprotein n=1 Tax=Deinococcus maricopensis (strain DSM 21211 / LMG 22137 / NRRL B-23946 / LB-34) TaxID=709986 RepID=E8U773_DEIML|nr:BMP family ABC transporter substrate-binding protein [Deinococcus maricopensis]ADV66912.1 basic membrane lipoprotein [Deinococcus maricopensis DSM 21211]